MLNEPRHALSTLESGNAPKDFDWVERTTRLKFVLGEFCLFTLQIPCYALKAHFLRLPKELAEPAGVLKNMDPRLQAVFLPSHPVEGGLARFARGPSALRYVPVQYPRFYIEIGGSFNEYLAKFSSKARKNLRQRLKKFTEFSGHEVPVREFRHPGEMTEFHTLAREVSKRTYQDKLLHAGLPDTVEFQNKLVRDAESGLVRGYILFHHTRPVAFNYCLADGDCLLLDATGYDPEYSEWSPGTVLLFKALENVFAEENFRIYDFGGGEAEYKRFFSTNAAQCADIYYFRCTVKNAVLLGLHSGLRLLSASIVRVLGSLRLKALVKKYLRGV